MLRSLLIVIFLFFFFLFSLPILLVFHFLYKKYPDKVDRMSLAIVQWALKGVQFLAGTELIVLGEEHVPKDQPVLYIGNHTTYFDVVMAYIRVPGLTGFVAKDNMLKVPVLRLWMKRVHCLFLNRTNIKEGLKTILAAIDKVKQGISIYIFPEGTRNHNPDTLMEFKEGSFKIAEKSGCLIIPVTFVNASQIYEAHRPFVKKAKVVIEYGAPIDMKELDKETRKHIGVYVRGIIAETYQRNKAEYF